ncbi:MAG: hypothetical protein M1831_007579 [Alyxoria varia]|nr:MAG: hypothetical protein M1831_007579 [Alyxoria varia]
MASTDPEDEDLLRRLQRLKPSSYVSSLGPSKPSLQTPSVTRETDNDLAARFHKLGGGQKSSSATFPAPAPYGSGESDTVPNGDDRPVEDLLQELEDEGKRQADKAPQPDMGKVAQLLKEAKEAVRNSSSDNTEQAATQDTSMLKRHATPEEDSRHEGEEADEYIRAALDDAEFEKRNEHSDVPSPRDHSYSQFRSSSHDPCKSEETTCVDDNNTPATQAKASFDFPSAPDTVLPKVLTGLASLSLPSAPTAAPSARSQAKDDSSANLFPSAPGYTEDEIESWCTICLEDATVRCVGCDGDLYCERCWWEGHRSEDAMEEERKHKAVKYEKGGGNRAKSQKTVPRKTKVVAG